MKSSILSAICCTALMVVIGCGCGNGGNGESANTAGSNSGSASSSSGSLNGAGSTLIGPAMSNWASDYQKTSGVDVQYNQIGSGGGITQLINHTVDFAGSDAPLNADEIADAKAPVLHFPAVIGAVAIAYNLPGVQSGLKLSGPVVAGIYLGAITHWNDPQIAALNPNVKLPDAAITVTHRTEGSGTTYIFTEYLCKISPDWKTKVGQGKAVQWPAGLGGKGSAGVAGLLQQHEGSIGYIELAYATQNSIAYAALQNASGAFVLPSSDSASAAADGVKLPANLTGSITNSASPKAYPIAGFSYLILYQNSQQADALKKFVGYCLGTGQSSLTRLSYGPIPDSVVKLEQNSLSTVK